MKAPPETEVRQPAPDAAAPASLGGTFKAIGWGFLGIRNRSGHDTARLKPLHLVAVALVAVIAFVAGLMALVHLIVPK